LKYIAKMLVQSAFCIPIGQSTSLDLRRDDKHRNETMVNAWKRAARLVLEHKLRRDSGGDDEYYIGLAAAIARASKVMARTRAQLVRVC
jgi:hypothetical protein